MITHITVEDAAKLISRIAGTNEMQALTYIREAADRGEVHAADALEKLQAELEQAKQERDAAVALAHEWEQLKKDYRSLQERLNQNNKLLNKALSRPCRSCDYGNVYCSPTGYCPFYD